MLSIMNIKDLTRFFLLSAFPIMLACNRSPQENSAQFAKEQIRTVTVISKTISLEFQSFGTAVYFNKADVFPTTEGYIESIDVEEGMKVKKGRVLAKINQQKLLIRKDQIEAEVHSKQALQYLAQEKLQEGIKTMDARFITIKNAEANLEQKRIELENISNTYENKKKLFEIGGVAEEELKNVKIQHLSAQSKLLQTEGELEIQKIGFRDEDIMKAGYEVPNTEEERKQLLIKINTRMLEAEKKVAEAQLNAVLSELKNIDLLLKETIITSPISGIIGSRYLDIGEKATPDKQLFTIFNIDKIYVQIDVSEKDLVKIKTGQMAVIIHEEDVTNKIEGEVKLISPFINPETRTARVKILVDNNGRDLIPGMFVRVTIITGKPQNHLLVDQDSVLTDNQNATYVFLVRNNILFKREVIAEFIYKDKIVITKGLEKGDIICKKPSLSYRDGLEVEVIP